MNVSFDFWVFGDLWNHFWPPKRQKKLENRTKRSKNERNVLFTDKKRTLRTKRSFVLNVNERRERIVLLKRTEKNVRTKRSFKKNGNSRVGHSVLLRSERTVLFRSLLDRNVLFRSFFEFLPDRQGQARPGLIRWGQAKNFLATYET